MKTINDKVNVGEELIRVYTEKEINKDDYLNTIKISKENIPEIKIVYEIIK